LPLDLSVTFGDPSNFRKETLNFEVVGFHSTYHVMLGWPCYAKFMAIPNYTNLKLKMLGPNRVITVHTTYQYAYKCDVECYEYAESIIKSKALAAELEARLKEAPDPKRSTGSFEPIEGVKEAMLVDFLRVNSDMFAWSPSDMPGILREVIEHSLDIRASSKPVRQ
jgi:hypothetical protein